jgi:hypothetical protein
MFHQVNPGLDRSNHRLFRAAMGSRQLMEMMCFMNSGVQFSRMIFID